MTQTIEFGGIQYEVSRRTNLNKVDTNYYKRLIAIFYEGVAADIGVDKEAVATALVDFAYISGQITGGAVLLTRNDTPEKIQAKCIEWLTNGDLADLGDVLTDAVNKINKSQPDTALAPEPLPDNADPKVLSVAKPNRKRRSPTG